MSQASLPIPGRSALLQLHLGEYSSCLEAVYAHDHAIIGIQNWLSRNGLPQLPLSYKANLKWSDLGSLNTLSGSPDMHGTPLYNYLLTMASPTVAQNIKEIKRVDVLKKKKDRADRERKRRGKKLNQNNGIPSRDAKVKAEENKAKEEAWWTAKIAKK